MSISNYLEAQYINHALKGVNMPTAPTNLFFSLHSADPSDTGASEVTSSFLSGRVSYASSNFSAPTTNVNDRQIVNSAILSLGSSTAASTGIPFLGIWDASTGGNFLWAIKLQTSAGVDSPLIFGSGDAIQFALGAIALRLDILKWSIYIRDIQLNWLRGTAAITAIMTSYMGLHSTLFADATGTELTTTVRTAGRLAIASTAWDALTTLGLASITKNSNNIDFGASVGNAFGYTRIGFWNAASAGNLIFIGVSLAPQDIVAGTPVFFTAGSISAGFS